MVRAGWSRTRSSDQSERCTKETSTCDKIETILPKRWRPLLGNSGEDPETDDALAEALQLDAVAMVAWQRFNGKGKGKSKCKGKIKGKGKGKNKGNNLSLEERKKRLAELKSRINCQACGARGHWAGHDICPRECQERGYIAITCTRMSASRRRDIRFRPRLDR